MFIFLLFLFFRIKGARISLRNFTEGVFKTSPYNVTWYSGGRECWKLVHNNLMYADGLVLLSRHVLARYRFSSPGIFHFFAKRGENWGLGRWREDYRWSFSMHYRVSTPGMRVHLCQCQFNFWFLRFVYIIIVTHKGKYI